MNTVELLRAAHAADSSGQTGRAEQLCIQVLEKEPSSVEALLLAGSIAARSNRFGEAVSLLRKALSRDPNSYDAARWLAGLLMGRDGGMEAVEHGRTAVRLRPGEAEAHIILGLACVAAGDNGQAIASFQRALALSPGMAGAYHNLGVAYQRDDNSEEAVTAFKQAIALSPGLLASHLHLGTVHLYRDEPEEALECAQRALEINPTSGTAKRLIEDANFLAIKGNRGEEHIRRAMSSDPTASFPHAMMGSWLQEQGLFEEAEASIQRSIEMQPLQGFAYFAFAHNRKMRETDRSMVERIEALAEDRNLNPADRRYIHFALGKAYDDLKEYAKAIHYLDLANQEVVKPDEGPATDLERYASRIRSYEKFFTKELLARYSDVGVESDEPIFIVGMPRSGTTLMEQIISRHSEVGAAGEQSFWRDHRRRIVDIQSGGLNVAELHKASGKYLDLLSSIAPGKRHVTDKFPSNYVHLGFLHLLYPNAKFIHTKRHPIDTALSIYMRPFFDVSEFQRSRRSIVHVSQLYREIMEHWRNTLPPGRVLEVDYEQMVTQPEEMTRKVIEFCDLEWEEACLHPEAGDRRVITYSKWQVRQPVYTTSVARWKNYEPWLDEFRELC